MEALMNDVTNMVARRLPAGATSGSERRGRLRSLQAKALNLSSPDVCMKILFIILIILSDV
ncbi:hypothetical protein VSS87_26545, partial [Escherichia coli]|uniref:hypothetical protein n=1 Tax=Escherichia coli TaxID=562 RepID=UPI002DD42744